MTKEYNENHKYFLNALSNYNDDWAYTIASSNDLKELQKLLYNKETSEGEEYEQGYSDVFYTIQEHYFFDNRAYKN